MPLHDWNRVEAGMFHHFHNSWIYKLADQLNAGALPPEFFAAGEQYTDDDVPDVLTLSRDSEVASHWPGTGAIAVAEHPPTAMVEEEAAESQLLRKQDRLAIREVSGSRLVAVIEIVSRGNKSSRRRLERFVEKASRLLCDGVHLLVVDLFPPGRLDPMGLHPLIWEESTGEPAHQPSTAVRLAVSYCSGPRLKAYLHLLTVESPLPEIPLFLDADYYIPAPLDSSYAAAWEHYPAPWKERLSARGI